MGALRFRNEQLSQMLTEMLKNKELPFVLGPCHSVTDSLLAHPDILLWYGIYSMEV